MSKFMAMFLMLFPFVIKAQTLAEPDFSEYPVADLDCFVFLPDVPDEWSEDASPDGSNIFSTYQQAGDYEYQVIIVQFETPFAEYSEEELLQVLTDFTDHLKSYIEIAENEPYAKGLSLSGYDDVVGVSSGWKDTDGNYSRMKGWINPEYLAILVVSGKTDPSLRKFNEYFLEGFSFPDE